MMSDEENDGEFFIRRPPAFRSEILNAFISELDRRSEVRNQKSKRPRIVRKLGDPVEKTILTSQHSTMDGKE